MFRKFPVIPIDGISPAKSGRRTTISAQKARSMLEKELQEIRHRLVRLEEEIRGVTPIRSHGERKVA